MRLVYTLDLTLCFIPALVKTLTRLGDWGIYLYDVRADHQMQARHQPGCTPTRTCHIEAPALSPIDEICLNSSKDRHAFSSLYLWLGAVIIEINLSIIATTFSSMFWSCSQTSPDPFHAHDIIRSSYALIRSSYGKPTIIKLFDRCHTIWEKSKIVTRVWTGVKGSISKSGLRDTDQESFGIYSISNYVASMPWKTN